jgi:hypothetical protein
MKPSSPPGAPIVPVLPDDVAVVNVGLSLFAEAVAAQGRPVVDVDWRIPAGGDLEAVAGLRRLYRPRAAAIDEANAEVVRRLPGGGRFRRRDDGRCHRDGSGQVGAGVAVAPVECFRSALLALDRKLSS